MANDQTTPSAREIQRALDRIDTVTARAQAARAAKEELDVTATLKAVCQTYGQLKPAIDTLIKLLESIGPLLGYDFGKIGTALRKVLDLIDLLCA